MTKPTTTTKPVQKPRPQTPARVSKPKSTVMKPSSASLSDRYTPSRESKDAPGYSAKLFRDAWQEELKKPRSGTGNTGNGASVDPDTMKKLQKNLNGKFDDLRQDPEKARAELKKTYDGLSDKQLDNLLKNGLVMPGQVRFVSRDKLKGAHGAFLKENNGTVLLAEDLKTNPQKLQQTFNHEVGHLQDNGRDSTGDEGLRFERLMEKGNLTSADMRESLKADQGTLTGGEKAEFKGRTSREYADALEQAENASERQRAMADILQGWNAGDKGAEEALYSLKSSLGSEAYREALFGMIGQNDPDGTREYLRQLAERNPDKQLTMKDFNSLDERFRNAFLADSFLRKIGSEDRWTAKTLAKHGLEHARKHGIDGTSAATSFLAAKSEDPKLRKHAFEEFSEHLFVARGKYARAMEEASKFRPRYGAYPGLPVQSPPELEQMNKAFRLAAQHSDFADRYSLNRIDRMGGDVDLKSLIAETHPDHALRKQAGGDVLNYVSKLPPIGQLMTRPLLDRVVDGAQGVSDSDYRQKVALGIPSSIPDKDVELYEKFYAANLTRAVKSAKEGSPLHKFGMLLHAKSLADHPEWGKHVIKCRVDGKIADLARGEARRDLERVRLNSLPRTSNPPAAAQELKSERFAKRLALLDDPEKKAELVNKELGKLAAMDPAAAKEVAEVLVRRDMENSAFQKLQDMSAAELSEALGKVSGSVPGAQMDPDETALIAKYAKEAIGKSKNISDLARKLSRLDEGVEGLADKTKVSRFMARHKEKLAGLTTAAAFYSMAKNELKTPEDVAGFVNDMVNVGGWGDDLLKLPGLSKVASRFPAFAGKMARVSKFLGPAGSVLSMGIDAYGGAKALARGDYHDAGGKGASLVGGGMIMAAALFSGPAAPIVLFTGIALSVGGMWYSERYGDSQEVQFLKELDVYKD